MIFIITSENKKLIINNIKNKKLNKIKNKIKALKKLYLLKVLLNVLLVLWLSLLSQHLFEKTQKHIHLFFI